MSVDIQLHGLVAGSVWTVTRNGAKVASLTVGKSGAIHFTSDANNSIGEYTISTWAGDIFGFQRLTISNGGLIKVDGMLLSGMISNKFSSYAKNNSKTLNYTADLTVPSLEESVCVFAGLKFGALNMSGRVAFDMGMASAVYAVRQIAAIELLKKNWSSLTVAWRRPDNSTPASAFVSSAVLLSHLLDLLKIERDKNGRKLADWATYGVNPDQFSAAASHNALARNIKTNIAYLDSFYFEYTKQHYTLRTAVDALNEILQKVLNSSPHHNRRALFSNNYDTSQKSLMMKYGDKIHSAYYQYVKLPSPWIPIEVKGTNLFELMRRLGDPDPMAVVTAKNRAQEESINNNKYFSGSTLAYEFMQYYNFVSNADNQIDAIKSNINGILSGMTSKLTVSWSKTLAAPNGSNHDQVLMTAKTFCDNIVEILDFYFHPTGAYGGGVTFRDQFMFDILRLAGRGLDLTTINHIIDPNSSWGNDIAAAISAQWFEALTNIYNSAAKEMESAIAVADKLQAEKTHDGLSIFFDILTLGIVVASGCIIARDIAAGALSLGVRSTKWNNTINRIENSPANISEREMKDLVEGLALDSAALDAAVIRYQNARMRIILEGGVTAHVGWQAIKDIISLVPGPTDSGTNTLPDQLRVAEKRFFEAAQNLTNQYYATPDHHGKDLTTLTYKHVQGYYDRFTDANNAQVSDNELYEIGVYDVQAFRNAIDHYTYNNFTPIYNLLKVPNFKDFSATSGGQALPNVNPQTDFYNVWLEDSHLLNGPGVPEQHGLTIHVSKPA